jgi:hypothetical protein
LIDEGTRVFCLWSFLSISSPYRPEHRETFQGKE